ncbi:MAG TPA: glycosyltransferase family 4 protein [Patescibacteria group bacterium]|nr:glycosyltransferase family 4 protein [Patescibacteria group bacterium]
MTACLYLEFSRITLEGGIMTAWKTQCNALRAAGVKVVTNPSEPHDVLHVYLPLLRSRWLVQKYHWMGKPLVTHVHVTAEDFKNSFRGSNLITPLMRWWLTGYYRKGDVILTPTEYTRHLVADRYHLSKDKMIAISNGIDVAGFSPNKDLREEYRKRYNMKGIVAFSLGWVFPRKGIFTFADVARKFSDTQFFWFGQSAPKAMTHAPRPINPPENANFAGFIDSAKGAMNAGDIFFFPSYEENQGIVVLEAAANGKAILLRDIPVYEGWMKHGENCFKAKTDEEFEKYLKILLNDEKLRKQFGEAARTMVKEHDLIHIGQKLKGIYESVLEKHSK